SEIDRFFPHDPGVILAAFSSRIPKYVTAFLRRYPVNQFRARVTSCAVDQVVIDGWAVDGWAVIRE
ncbi:MAG TPA: hypothetical protein VGM27_09340, partial [Acidobacteriaceae bacterium]